MSVNPQVVVDSMVRFPKNLLSSVWGDRNSMLIMMERLTIKPRSFEGREVEPIVTFEETETEIAVPMAFGLQILQTTKFARVIPVRKTSKGREISIPTIPKPRDDIKGQEEFFANLWTACAGSYGVVLGQAGTGKGKTVAGAYLIAMSGVTSLVVVPNELIRDQWIATFANLCGVDPSRIGQVGFGAKSDAWRDKDIVIGCVNTVSMSELPKEFYQEFGLTIFDECHVMGAAKFSQATRKVCSEVKVGLTATPNRKNGTQLVFDDYFGEVAVKLEADMMPSEVWVIDYRRPLGTANIKALGRGVLLNIISKDKARNNLLVRAIHKMHLRERNIIALTDRIDQLGHIHSELLKAGVPDEDIGYLAGEKFVNGVRTKTTKSDDLHARESAKIILATYARAKMGVNIPRLDAGIELTPIADAVQAIGRILRQEDDKKQPTWFTIVDKGIPLFEGAAVSRVRGLKEMAGATIVEV